MTMSVAEEVTVSDPPTVRVTFWSRVREWVAHNVTRPYERPRTAYEMDLHAALRAAKRAARTEADALRTELATADEQIAELRDALHQRDAHVEVLKAEKSVLAAQIRVQELELELLAEVNTRNVERIKLETAAAAAGIAHHTRAPADKE